MEGLVQMRNVNNDHDSDANHEQTSLLTSRQGNDADVVFML
jgi:hypothetical protein